jgi:predicted glutamine amidotransferase
MCRMFFKCSTEPFNFEINILKKFVKSCHWQYLHKYNLFGHHNLGWGFAYLNENLKLVIKRDITPIYKADWEALSKMNTRFLLVHARKAHPWKKDFNDIHPINIQQKYMIAHNGVIKTNSFPPLRDPRLENIRASTSLDTRRYLCAILDKVNNGISLKNTLEEIFRTVEIAAGANAFLFNSNECNIITHHNTNFNGRHHTLFINNIAENILVCTTPLLESMKEIANDTLIKINLSDLSTNLMKLEI